MEDANQPRARSRVVKVAQGVAKVKRLGQFIKVFLALSNCRTVKLPLFRELVTGLPAVGNDAIPSLGTSIIPHANDNVTKIMTIVLVLVLVEP